MKCVYNIHKIATILFFINLTVFDSFNTEEGFVHDGGPARTRTWDQWIMSPLL